MNPLTNSNFDNHK